MRKLFLPLIAALALAAVAFPAAALASPPGNDDFANATAISSLPFSDSVNIVEAQYEPGESSNCGVSNTVWYSFTPSSDEMVRADQAGTSFFGAVINLYRQDGSGLNGLTFLGCSAYYTSKLTFQAQAGQTYYFQAGSSYYGSGNLAISVQEVLPPPNDDFANATGVASLPFGDNVDTTAATVEPGEPHASDCINSASASVWYAFTPATSESVVRELQRLRQHRRLHRQLVGGSE